MLLFSTLLLAPLAQAASLDNLEVGGFGGSPLATDGTASWWNPAGLAAGEGTRITIEGAPTFATVLFDRADPHGGLDTYHLTGVVPFAGVATDLGVHGLGLGASFAIPIVRGGTEEGFANLSPYYGTAGTGSYTLRDGSTRELQATLGGAYDYKDKLAIGISGALVVSQWTAVVDNDAMPDLDQQITQQGQVSGYTNGDLETPDYKATLDFNTLQDEQFTFGAGARVTPVPSVAIGIAFLKGVSVNNIGTVNVVFQCPPQSDAIGRFGAEQFGICNSTIPADAEVSYSLPSRVHGGIGWEATPELHVEADAGWVGWSVFKDYTIAITNPQGSTDAANTLLTQTRLWARDNKDAVWFGASGHGTFAKRLTLGGKIIYDKSAIPDEAVSPNNYDADDILVSGLLSFKPIDQVTIGVSYTHHFLATRDITTSNFGMSLPKPDLSDPGTDRWYYPNANGKYSGEINRVGIVAQIALGKKRPASRHHESEERGDDEDRQPRHHDDDDGGDDGPAKDEIR